MAIARAFKDRKTNRFPTKCLNYRLDIQLLTFGSEYNNDKLIHPVPHPISRNFNDRLVSNCCRTNSTNSSVSGLGMNTGGCIFNVNSRKSHSLIMYCSGILAIRHSQSCSNRSCSDWVIDKSLLFWGSSGNYMNLNGDKKLFSKLKKSHSSNTNAHLLHI